MSNKQTFSTLQSISSLKIQTCHTRNEKKKFKISKTSPRSYKLFQIGAPFSILNIHGCRIGLYQMEISETMYIKVAVDKSNISLRSPFMRLGWSDEFSFIWKLDDEARRYVWIFQTINREDITLKEMRQERCNKRKSYQRLGGNFYFISVS